MSGNGNIDDIAQMCFEDALAELESIVRRLEEGAGKLEEAIVAYERGLPYSVIAMRNFRRLSRESIASCSAATARSVRS